MALTYPIDASQTEAKKPIDEQLMDDIRLNLEDLDTRLLLSSGSDLDFRVNGPLDLLGGAAFDLDVAFVAQERTLNAASVYLKNQGLGGNLTFDVKRSKTISRSITNILDIFNANTQSIARGSGSIITQSVTRFENSFLTQSIDFGKTAVSIDNIIQVVGSSLFRFNLSGVGELDEDYAINDYAIVSGATTPANNGTWPIKEVNQDGGRNIVLEIGGGASQVAAGGTIQLNIIKYDYLASVTATAFVAGEDAIFSGHTDPSNNGTFTIHKINDGGNNILVKKGAAAIIVQGGLGGQADTLRFQYNFTASVAAAFAIGEVAEFTAHTAPANDGSLEILLTNQNAGFNIVVYNVLGVVQGGVAGQVDTNRWVYALDQDPDGFYEIGDNTILAGHDNALNDGTFPVVDVKYLATDNIVIYNAVGVVQLTPNGTVSHSQKAIIFEFDYSTDFVIDKSSALVENNANAVNDGTYIVLDVNRTAVSPYNIIVEIAGGVEQLGDSGIVTTETRSIFNDGAKTIAISQDRQVKTYLTADIDTDPLAANTLLTLDILATPSGSSDLAVNIK